LKDALRLDLYQSVGRSLTGLQASPALLPPQMPFRVGDDEHFDGNALLLLRVL